MALPGSEVCAIIEACGKADVRVLRYKGLYLARGPARPKPPAENPLPSPGYPVIPVPDHPRQNAEALARDEEEVKAERLRMLMIEDPIEYERQLRDGELEEDEPEQSDD